MQPSSIPADVEMTEANVEAEEEKAASSTQPDLEAITALDQPPTMDDAVAEESAAVLQESSDLPATDLLARTTPVSTQPGPSHEPAPDVGNVPPSPKVSSASKARDLSIARVVRDFRSFLRECVLMVMDEGLKFDDLKPSLELYLRNIGFLGGADLLAEHSARLAEVEDDLLFWRDLHAVHLPSIIEAKVDQVLQDREAEVAKSTEAMEAITRSVGEVRTRQARINVELAEATRAAGAQVETMERARSAIAEAQKTLADTEAAHAQTSKRIADLEAHRGQLTEQVEARLSDLKEIENHAQEVLAATDEEIRARAEQEAKEQHVNALQDIEAKLRSLE
jgi:hypothetical protein